MSTWNIYHKDGSKLTDVNGEQITVHGLEYSDSWMGECFVTINFKNEVPINFQIGDYIVYRGERFELNYEPGKDKQARPDTYGEGFVYDSVKFNALQDELARAEFLDVVLNDNELHYTSLPKFPFFVQTLDDLLDRIQANLDEQIGAGLWKIYSRNKERSVQRGALESEWLSVYGEKTEDNVIESMSITVDSQTCWQALALVNEKWNINFIVRGRNIYVGTTGIEAGHIFSYGIGNGLYEIVQNADSEQSVITRLRAYGSEKNLPSHYYADLGIKYVANITKVIGASTNVELELDIDYIETYFKNKRKYVVSGESQEQSNGWVLQVTFDFQTTITGYVTQSGSSDKCRFYSELKGGQVDSGDEESKEKLDAFIAQVNAGNTKMYITSGLNKKIVPSSMKEYAENLPNNMAVNRLMLPGFPHVSLSDFYDSLTEQEKKYVNPTGKLHKFSTDPYRPYIDSLNIEEIGLRSASQFFDTDDKMNGVIEIYPTIEEMQIGGVRVDEIDEGVAPDDDGRFGDNETVKNVDIYLNKAIDFDINDLKDDDFSISMKDGMCGGRTFKVASSTKVDGRWRLTIERSKDDALELWFPYKDYPIKSGDHFVLTGITLPDSYVKAASLKLLKYAIALLDKNDYTRYVYQPKVDELFMARQHDKAQADETGTIKSLHDTLKAGDLMNFNDTDLNIEGIISIDQLTIKEEDGKIPTYDITLREDKEVGTIQKMQQQISSLQSGNGGTGAGLTTTQVKNQVATEGSKHFISKINDDTAKGTITWEKVQKFVSGLLVGNFNSENGGSWTPDAEGRSHLITDYLEVRMKAIFEELVIKKTSTIGGKEIISPAGGVVAHKVEEVTVTYNNVSQKAYRCYFLAEQEGDAVDNDFSVNDQVRSESFNVRKGTYHKVGNHFYWRLVIGRDEEPVELEGKKYHYIDLSDTDCATASDVPAKGDVLSQCGNRTDVERQNCLIFSAVDTYSPSVSLYHGINSYSFANKEYVEYGVNKQTNKAFFNVYGDMYVGDRPTKENGYEGSSYVKYDSATKQVVIKGKLSARSTVDGKELSQYIKENSAKGLTEEQVNNLIKNSQVIADLQNQVDGAIETWFYDGVPTLKNAPASSWTTDKDKDTHLGDLYYDNKTGKAYRFAKDGNTYKWTIITDTDIAKALSDASKAQETADGKMKVFSTQPIPPYQLGDIWVNATYPTDGSIYKNEILRCQTAKTKGSSFAIADWTKASKYTDDSALNTFKEEYKNDMASYKEQLDEKVETWFYNYAPTTQNKPASDWTTDTLKSQHAGDLFYNTSNGYTYRWTGTAWARIKDNDINTAMTAASKAQDTADGKRTVFTSQPTVPYDEGDLWASGGDDGKTLMVCVKSRTTGSFTSSEWVKANDSDLNAFAKTIEDSLTGIQDQLDKKAETWYQSTDPSTSWTTDDAKKKHKGDLWYNTSNNKTFFWNGTKWDKQDVPTEVFDKIDGKSSIYVSKPASYEERDLWILEAAYTLGGVAYSKGELVVATKTNASFSAADWTKKVKYTDDTVANAAKKAAEEAKKAADTAQTNVTNLGKTVTTNKKAFDSYVTDGYLEPSEIAAMAQDSKRLEDAFAAAEKSYTEVKEAAVLKDTKELTDLNTAFTTLSTAKTELVAYLSDISARYNAADTKGKATIVSAVGTKFTNFQSAYSAFYDKLGLANAYITSKIYGDLKQNITDLAGYKYIKDALGQTTDIDGGLVMTTLLALRDADGNVQSGINGAIDPNRGKKSIATWWGGRMVDKDYNSGSLTPATSLVRFDGSGYLANGAIWWDVDGKVHAAPTSFIISEKNLGAYLTFFEPTWKSGSAGTSVADLVSLKPNAPFSKLGVSGDATFEGAITLHGIKITYDATNKAIKVDGNLYATGGITAYGAGASTTGGGGLNASVISYARIIEGSYTDADLTSIPNAYAIKALSSRIDNIATELGGLSLSWNNITGKPSTFAPSAHTHKWAEITDRITKVSQLANDAGYLTSHQSLAGYATQSWVNSKGYITSSGSCAYSTSAGNADTVDGYHANGLLTALSNSDKGISITVGGTTKSVSNISVNYAGSAGNADTVDGEHASDFSYTHQTSFDFSKIKSSRIVTFDQNGTDYGWINGFASTHDNYLTSVIFNTHRSSNWYVGYIEGIFDTGKTNGLSAVKQLAFLDSNVASATRLQTARNIWGNSFNGTSDINGSIIVPSGKHISIGNIKMEYDATNKALKITNTMTNEVANLYTSGGITAYGVGTSSSSGGGLNGSVKSYADALKLTSESLSEVASAYSIKQLSTRITSLEGGSATSISVSGSGNAVTSITKNGTTINVVKGSTFLTSHQSLANYVTINDSRLSDSRYPKFANDTWYLVGDDVYIGDNDRAGIFCIKSADTTNVSGIAIYNNTESDAANIWFDNININLDKQLVMNDKRIWVQGVGTAGGNNNRLTLVAGMPSGLAHNTSCRGTILYSNGIAFADPYNGNSNNDSGWIRHLETTPNVGTLEIAVGDDNANEEIHFRWYDITSTSEHIGNDITVPRATGTLALTSQIPTTLPANGGNADKVDNYDIADETRQVYRNNYTVTNPAGAWILIKLPAFNAINEIITIDGYGNNCQSHCVVHCGSRFQGIWGYQSEYNGVVVTNIRWREVDLGKFAIVARIGEEINNLVIRATNYLEISKTTEDSNAFAITSSFFSSGGVFHGNVDWNNIIGKPSTFNPAPHSHNYAANENYGGFTKSGRLPISGFYQSYESESGGNAPWAGWMHLINCQHSNINNNYALQIAASFYDNNTFKIRVTNDNVNNAWRDIIHSGNIGSQSVNYAASAGNADTVDGYHANGLLTALSNSDKGISITVGGTTKSVSNISVNYAGSAGNADTVDGEHASDFSYTHQTSFDFSKIKSSRIVTFDQNGTDYGWINGFASTHDNYLTSVIFNTHRSSNWYVGYIEGIFDTGKTNGLSAVKQLAFLDSNVASATRLQTARNIWGQSFDGTANVNGSITGVDNITMSNNSYLYGKNTGGTAIQLIAMASWNSVDIGRGALTYGYTTQVMGKTVAITASDDSGNNIKSVELSTAKLYSNVTIETEGGLLAHGGVTAYSSSDIRLKQDLRKLDYLSIIKAMGGTFGFAWKKDNTRSIGWIAQHVLCNPHLKDIVETDEKGYYKINYWSPKLIATAFGAIEQVGDEVSRLKARVIFLESEVQRLSGKQDGNNKKRLDNKNINLLN